MDLTTTRKVKKSWSKAFGMLPGDYQPEVRDKMRRYFGVTTVQCTSGMISMQAWRNRRKNGTDDFNEIEFLEKLWGEYGYSLEWQTITD